MILWFYDPASLKQHCSSLTALRSYLVFHPHSLARRKLWESSYLFNCPQEQSFIWGGDLDRFRDFTLSKLTPTLFSACVVITYSSHNHEKSPHISSAPVRRAAAHSPARSGPRNGPLNRVTSPGCQESSCARASRSSPKLSNLPRFMFQ